MFVGLEIFVSQFIEPLLYRSSTGISALAILVSAVFWTAVWGPIGLLLSMPLTVLLVVMGKYVPQLKFLDILLGDEPVLEPPERIYQRLLALDQEEAVELAQEYRQGNSVEALYDQVLIPVLTMAQADHHRGTLDEERWRFVLQGLRTLIEEMGDREKARIEGQPRPTGPAKGAPDVVCLPANEEAKEIACAMLAQLLDSRGYCVVTASAVLLIGEKAALVEEHRTATVCISAVAPNPVARARPLCKWLSKIPRISG